ncbi:MAG: 3-hydroxyacyl-CoA dehydrogenase [Alphaproteobacteria bacterium]|nr:3-hydroxyacyl-CoA dehydrogenase [Alphaproteobacteria bacterium]
MEKIALIGSGLIGTGWGIVFSESGRHPVLFDTDHNAIEKALVEIRESLNHLNDYGLIEESPEIIFSRISTSTSIEDAVDGAVHVQESIPERAELKKNLFEKLDKIVPDNITIASSTSTIPVSSFTEHLSGRARCIVMHPGTPPHLLRLVEIVPSPWTAPEVITSSRKLMEDCRQATSVLKKEIQGFVLNRIQYAVISEVYRLWEDDVAGIEDIEKTVREALGLRWSFMGAMETISLNAPGGVPDYNQRYGKWVNEINATQQARPWNDDNIKRLEIERLKSKPAVSNSDRRNWRDKRLMALLAHKRERSKIEGN